MYQVQKIAIFLFFLLCCFLSSCQIQYADSYNGEYDSRKDFASEGLVTSIYHVLAVGKLDRPLSKSKLPKYTDNKRCSEIESVNWDLLVKIEQDLRRDFAGDWIDVQRRRDTLLVHMPGRNYYEIGHEHVNPDFYPVMDRLIARLKQYRYVRVEFIGHTDSWDTKEYNQDLSKHRANNMERYFNRYSISGSATVSSGKGETDFLVSNATSLGRSLNRRVTLLICTTDYV